MAKILIFAALTLLFFPACSKQEEKTTSAQAVEKSLTDVLNDSNINLLEVLAFNPPDVDSQEVPSFADEKAAGIGIVVSTSQTSLRGAVDSHVTDVTATETSSTQSAEQNQYSQTLQTILTSSNDPGTMQSFYEPLNTPAVPRENFPAPPPPPPPPPAMGNPPGPLVPCFLNVNGCATVAGMCDQFALWRIGMGRSRAFCQALGNVDGMWSQVGVGVCTPPLVVNCAARWLGLVCPVAFRCVEIPLF